MSKREKIALVICLIAAVWFGSAYSDRVNEYNELSASYQTLQYEYDELSAINKTTEAAYEDARLQIDDLSNKINRLNNENASLYKTVNDLRALAEDLMSSKSNSASSSYTSSNYPYNSAPKQQVTYYVWCSRTGTKYHSRSNCSNMKNPIYTTLDNAIASGRTPCSKCY